MILRFNSLFKEVLLLHGLPYGVWYNNDLTPNGRQKKGPIFDSMVLVSNPTTDLYKIYLTKEELINELRQTDKR